MKKLNLAITLVAFILLLASCQQQNDAGRYITFMGESKRFFLDTKTGAIFRYGEEEENDSLWMEGKWIQVSPPIEGKRPDQP